MSNDLLQRLRVHGAVPGHIAIIMDGNGRWAKGRSLPRPLGHHAGMKAVREVVEGCLQAGVGGLTLFAFSQENWKRPAGEIEALMKLLEEYIAREASELREQGVSVRVLNMSTIAPLDEDAIRSAMRETGAIVTAEEATTTGGLGAAVAAVVVTEPQPVPMRMLGVHREFAPTGSTAFLLEHFKLTAADIRAAAIGLARA